MPRINQENRGQESYKSRGFDPNNVYRENLSIHAKVLSKEEKEELVSIIFNKDKNKSQEWIRQEGIETQKRKLRRVIHNEKNSEEKKERARQELEAIGIASENRESSLKRTANDEKESEERRQEAQRELDAIKEARKEIEEIEKAKQKLALSYLRLVYILAQRKHAKLGFILSNIITINELISAGNLGIMKALNYGNFDPKIGINFTTYAATAVKNEMTNLVDKKAKEGEKPDDIGINLAQDKKSLLVGIELEKKETRQRLLSILDSLDETDKAIIIMSYGLGKDSKKHTLEEVAKELGLEKSRVQDRRTIVLRKIRKYGKDYF